MWTDNETDEDLLGFSIHADLLKSIVADPTMLPATIGLFGDWGGGKSSILKVLQKDLEKDDEIAVIYFNSWVFEGYEDAKSAILASLLNELCTHKILSERIGDEARDLLKRVNWMKVLKLGSTAAMSYFSANPLAFLTNLVPNTSKPDTESDTKKKEDASSPLSNLDLKGLFKEASESVNDIRSFRDDFENLIKKTELSSVVILIDDLDRCAPERLIENLEAIKLFLNVNRTAFIVATDRRIVKNAIRIRYSKLFEREGDSTGDALVTDYLEKLIQVPYSLPKLAPHEVRSYMNLLFLKKYLSNTQFAQITHRYKQFQEKDRYKAFTYDEKRLDIEDNTTRQQVTESMRLVEACSDAITDGLKGNPRQIKRFLNSFWLRRELAKVAKIHQLKDHILIKLMVLEYISDDRFEDIFSWHKGVADGTVSQLKALEEYNNENEIPDNLEKWKTPRIWRWLQTEPKIGEEDLRDYFWVARSSLTDTLSGIRLMTQAMRTCAEQIISAVEPKRKEGISLFENLDEDEQEGVLGIVRKHAMQHISEDHALRSLLDLSEKEYINAASSLEQCISRIGPEKLPPGFGVALRNFKPNAENPSSQKVISLIRALSNSGAKIGKALNKQNRPRS